MTNSSEIEPADGSDEKIWLNILQDAYLNGRLPSAWPTATTQNEDWKRLAEDLISIHNLLPQLDAGELSSDLKVNGVFASSLISLQNAVRDQRNLAVALQNMAGVLNSAKSLDDVFASLLENIEHIAPHDTVDLLLVDPTGIARVKCSEGYQKFFPDAQTILSKLALTVDYTPNLRIISETGQPYLVNDLTLENWMETEITQWAKSHLGLPILVKGKVAGFLILLSAVPGVFTQEHILRLRAFADQAAVAIEKANLIAQINELATIDSLTGIANRRHFFNIAEQELTRAVRYSRPLAALMIDVDNFRSVNDTFGHGIGDEVLVEIAHRCKKELRSMDLLGRYGGEEFSIILPETNAESALIVADRLRKMIANKPFFAHNEAFKVTVSIGVTGFESKIPSARALLDQADQALYLAKQSGRNRVAKSG